MTLVMLAAVGLATVFVANQLYRRMHTATADAGAPIAHVGADEHWRPALEMAADPPAAVVGHTEADVFEHTLAADFDALIASMRADPPWLTEWRDSVDAAYAAAGLDTASHHRWRWDWVDVPTGEYRLVPEEGGA